MKKLLLALCAIMLASSTLLPMGVKKCAGKFGPALTKCLEEQESESRATATNWVE